MRQIATALVALFVASSAFADEARTFTGLIDDQQVVVELTDGADGEVAGRFAYLDKGGDVPLLPSWHDGNNWVLHEEAPCDESTCRSDDEGNAIDPPLAAAWTLTFDPETFFATGTRTTLGDKPKTSTIELHSASARELTDSEDRSAFGLHDRSGFMSYDQSRPLDWDNAPYEMTLMDVLLDRGPEESLGAATIQYVTDPRTRFAFPRVVSFTDSNGDVAAANAILAEAHGRMNLGAFDCLAFQYASYGRNENLVWAGGTLGDYDNETVRLTYASPKLLSWVQSGSLWCSGAHPYNHIDSYTIEIATGEPLDLSKVFADWVPREWGAALETVADPEDARSMPENFYWGPSTDMIAYVRGLVPDDFFDAELEEVCFTDQTIAEQLDIRFEAAEQVTFTLSGFPHVSSVCNGDLATVPLAEVEQFLTPGATPYLEE